MSGGRARRLVVSALGAASALALFAPAAGAHHSIFVREVLASSVAPDQAFVELQAYRQGQGSVAAATLQAYDATGLVRHDFVLPGNVSDDRSQRTILIGAPALAGTADFVDPMLGSSLSPTGGAVCFPEANPPECASWGSFSGALPFPGAGSRAPAIPEGSSLTRTIARGCTHALDEADDSNNSSADFAVSAPSPRPSSVIPTERECIPCGGLDATIVGTDAKETLRGTRGNDVIAGLAGADKIRGLAGNDVLCGGIGKDILVGGRGRDRLIGNRGRDVCRGGKGRDTTRSCEGP